EMFCTLRMYIFHPVLNNSERNSMFLSDQAIAKCLLAGSIIIGPEFDEKNIRPVGIRLHLGRELLMPEPGQTVSLTEAANLKYRRIDLVEEEFFLEPGEFVLGSTYETVQTSRGILAFLDGRSTVARIGLTTHITAAIIDGTFEGPHACTLEIKNVGNFRVRLKFKDPIGLMLFAELKEPVAQKLQSQYTKVPDKVMPPNLGFKTGEDR
ncbi:MAG TPA: dCTP deaminase, partial [Gammaproteobacteria bacterium]|nr:dCTP deaminase [Gammaproteobacteria bacterium]